MLRIASNGQTMVLSTCFEEEVTYMICTLRIIEPEPVHFSFSSVAQVIFCVLFSLFLPLRYPFLTPSL